jgi:rare lipoprotein A
MRLPVNHIAAPLALIVLLAACGGNAKAPPALSLASPAAVGPAADYPMVLGAPFVVDGVTYTPADKMNYDHVGHAVIGAEGGAAISGAHRTLPLPSYAEVTALDSGRTILVRMERRGPASGPNLVELSPGAAAQLGLSGRAPVRVRRVNPPEVERALLRSGSRAPERMETPKPLLTVLMRKLDPATSPPAPKASVASSPPPVVTASAALKPIDPDLPLYKPPVKAPAVKFAAEPHASDLPLYTPPPKSAAPGAAPKPAPAISSGDLVIQAGAYSAKPRAEAAASAIGGKISAAGNVWRVRKGPFTSRAAAEAALAQVRRAGYGDARILRAD